MSRALIGHTGFVGSNLARQSHFEHCFNSKNISQIDHRSFDIVYCAGVSAVKWWANKNPDQDKAAIDQLVSHLDAIETKKFVLLSTIDVYPHPVDVDESTDIVLENCHPYGKHRLLLERYMAERFDTLIVRLPGLFGEGLKKNVIFDFLNENNVEQIDSNASFQFYFLEHLTSDINKALDEGLALVNITSEPLVVSEVAEYCLGRPFVNAISDTPAQYDYKSRYAELFGGRNGYMYCRNDVLKDLRSFVSNYRRR